MAQCDEICCLGWTVCCKVCLVGCCGCINVPQAVGLIAAAVEDDFVVVGDNHVFVAEDGFTAVVTELSDG